MHIPVVIVSLENGKTDIPLQVGKWNSYVMRPHFSLHIYFPIEEYPLNFGEIEVFIVFME